MIDQILLELRTHFYMEYAVCVWAVTSLIRWAFRGIDGAIHPKWVTLMVGIIVGLAGYALKAFQGTHFDFFKIITSFGLATVGYDYLGKPLIDKITGHGFDLGKTHR